MSITNIPNTVSAEPVEVRVGQTALRRAQGERLERAVRTNWTRPEIATLFDLPFDELVFQAATMHIMPWGRYSFAHC
jgi:hypothetical protein